MYQIIGLVLRAAALAMGICVAILCQTQSVTYRTALTLLSIGLICMALSSLDRFNSRK